jgi:CHAT domain/SIR2-like domain
MLSAGNCSVRTEARTRQFPSREACGGSSPRKLRQPSERLRSVLLIANPRKRNGRPLDDIPNIDVAEQLSAVTAQLNEETELRSLTGSDACKDRLRQELAEGTDILYLVCHGQLMHGKPTLFLERADQELENIDGSELVDIIAGQLLPPPQLVVLGSCQSAGGSSFSDRSDRGFLSSLGALMIGAGVPAVIGMQGDVQQQTNAKFFGDFFHDLFAHGQVEQATSAGRQAVSRMPDWWMPTLLLSKEDGQLWPPTNARQAFADWDVLLDKIDTGECTPILGSDAVRAFSNGEFAKKLLSEMHGKVETGSSDELSWVAQQYKVLAGKLDVTERFNAFIRTRLAEDGIRPSPNEKLQDTVWRWGDQPKVTSQLQVLNDLASLPFPYYVTTNPDELLEQALKRANKSYGKQVCPWKGQMKDVQSIDPDSIGTVECPLVYHLFGALAGKDQERSSVVLTEDDFFDHLLWIANHNNLVPVKTPLCNSSLLFLGFRLRDWEFRILLRCIATIPGMGLLQRNTHAAVQIPLEGDLERQRRTRELLDEYFKHADIKLSIYYGSVEDFVKELNQRWRKRHAPEQLWQQAHN